MNPTLILAGKLAGTAALATGALVTGVTATHSSASASSTPSASAKQVHCGHAFGKKTIATDPKLAAALKAARAEPKGEQRRHALRTIRKDAVKGSYGDAAQIRALHLRVTQLRLRAIAPDDLKAALKAARAKPAGAERKAAFAAVRKDAVAGTYGEKVQRAATKRQEHRQTCQAKREAKKQDATSS